MRRAGVYRLHINFKTFIELRKESNIPPEAADRGADSRSSCCWVSSAGVLLKALAASLRDDDDSSTSKSTIFSETEDRAGSAPAKGGERGAGFPGGGALIVAHGGNERCKKG